MPTLIVRCRNLLWRVHHCDCNMLSLLRGRQVRAASLSAGCRSFWIAERHPDLASDAANVVSLPSAGQQAFLQSTMPQKGRSQSSAEL